MRRRDAGIGGRVGLYSSCWLVLATLFTSGCGYQTGSLIRAEYRRVALPMFRNETFYRDLEVALTRQVERELSSRPGIFIVPPESADIVLQGTIVGFQQRVLSEDDRDRVRESSATTTVHIEIRDGRNPDRVIEAFDLSDRAEFFLARGENLATAEEESFFDLARQIVNALEMELPRVSGPRSSDEAAGSPTGNPARAPADARNDGSPLRGEDV